MVLPISPALFLRADNAPSQLSFGTVGMFSAVSNLGAGGTQDVALSDTSQGVLYGLFALTGLVSGGINNSESLNDSHAGCGIVISHTHNLNLLSIGT